MYVNYNKTISYNFELDIWSEKRSLNDPWQTKLESYIEENVTDEMTDLAKAWRQKYREQQSGHIRFFMEHVLIEWLDENYRDSTLEFQGCQNIGVDSDKDDKADYYQYYGDYGSHPDYSDFSFYDK